VNIVNHVYLNLGGQGSGSKGLYEHEVQINGDEYTELTEDWSIPTGKLIKVEGTPYDLRKPTNLGKAIREKGEGYDINYSIRGTGMRQVAVVSHPPSGRVLQVTWI
jgi:aldose 1-epimerase